MAVIASNVTKDPRCNFCDDGGHSYLNDNALCPCVTVKARQQRAARAKAKAAQRGDRCACGCILLCPGETQCASCRGVG